MEAAGFSVALVPSPQAAWLHVLRKPESVVYELKL